MKKPVAIGCGLFLALIVAGIGTLYVQLRKGVKLEPAAVQALATEILTLPTPPGLEAEFGFDLFGAKLAVFQGADERNSMVMASIPRKALEDSDAEWRAQTQVDWTEYDAEAEIENGELEMSYAGGTLTVETTLVRSEQGSYRSFMASIPMGEEEVKLFRVGPMDQVTDANFQALLDAIELR